MEVQIENNKEHIRSLIETFYDLQKLRIATGNRMYQTTLKHLIDNGNDVDGDKATSDLLKMSVKEYNDITDDIECEGITTKSYLARNSDKYTIIKDPMVYREVGVYRNLLSEENKVQSLIKREVEKHHMWDSFFKDVTGCGHIMAGVLISYIDISKARYPSSLWKYCGLDVVVDENGKGKGRNMSMLESVQYTVPSTGEVKTKMSITYNPFLKTKILGVLVSGFLKKPGCKYDAVYRDYRARLKNREELTLAHQNRMAIRYTAKIFLRDMWYVWRVNEGLPTGEPYEVAFLGKQPHHSPRVTTEFN